MGAQVGACKGVEADGVRGAVGVDGRERESIAESHACRGTGCSARTCGPSQTSSNSTRMPARRVTLSRCELRLLAGRAAGCRCALLVVVAAAVLLYHL